MDRIELGLGQPHPVLLGDFLEVDFRQVGDPDFPRRTGHAPDQILGRLEQGDDAAGRPKWRRRAAGLAELGRLALGAGVGILDARRNGAGFEQSFGKRVGVGRIGFQRDADPHAMPPPGRPKVACAPPWGAAS